MTRDDIIRLAEEASCMHIDDYYTKGAVTAFSDEQLKRFAALVAAEKEQQMIRDGWRQCAKGQRTTQYCGLLEEAVKAEREACARLCFDMAQRQNDIRSAALEMASEYIRARGE